MSGNDPTDICPVCGPSSVIGEDGDCAHCGATLITQSVLHQIEVKQRKRCAGICEAYAAEHEKMLGCCVYGEERERLVICARELGRRIRGEK